MPDLIDDYQQQLVLMTDEAEVQADAVYQQHAAGLLSVAEATALLSAIIVATAARASSLAEVVAAAWLSKLDGADVLPASLTPEPLPVLQARISASLERTLIARDGVSPIHKVIRAATYDTATETLTTFVAAKAPNKHWRRRTEGTKCPVCNGLAAEGREFKMSTPMKRHTGCRCFPQPVD